VIRYGVFFGALVIAIVLIEAFFIEPVTIDGSALEPSLRNGDRIFVNKRMGGLSRGDLLLFGYPKKPSVRILLRVVALPGERVQLRDGLLYIGGQQVPEPYISQDHNLKRSSTDEIEVPGNSYFMLGDNRDDAFDSRLIGPVPGQFIYAKYLARYWPLKSP